MLGDIVFLLSFCSLLQLAASEAYFSLKFLSFINPGGKQKNGKCCDVFCFSDCDHKFFICLDSYGSLISQRCFTSGKTPDRDSITFGSTIGGLSNPIVWRMRSWPGQMGVTIQVTDVDVNFDDDVDTLQKTIYLKPPATTWLTIAHRTRLYVVAEIHCGQFYYGPDCALLCIPGSTYSCNQHNGGKICKSGWTGNDCSIAVNNCIPNKCQNGGVCHNMVNSFNCSCPLGIKGNLCEQDINECLDQDVCNHGNCINTVGSFACSCHTGYTGNKCTVDIDECLPSPCQNGATCDDLIGAFRCGCSVGFTGVHCDNDINECDNSSVKCPNGGVCVNTHGSHHCQCPSGYSGHTCETDVNECLSNPCKHNSTCLNLPGGYLCTCEQGYTGVNCEENINECLDGICKNGATCTDLDGSFSCVCLSFWQGGTCEEDVNECLSDPCMHGGTCLNIDEGFLCACPNEYEGSLCEEDRNECDLEETCENNSTCINSFGSFTCKCLEGWSGSRCEVDINECEKIPCNNSGTCINIEGGYNCECPLNWTGTNCEEDVNECALELSPCRNNATCLNKIGTFYCECGQGWTGHLCNEDLNECLQSPDICRTIEHSQVFNHSLGSLTPSPRVCMNTYLGYVCICSEGWAGQDCEHGVDTLKPFYLACHPTDNLTIDEDLRQMFLDTQLFQGMELNVSHKAGPETFTKGKVTSSIYPVVTVDGLQMSNHEVVFVINMMSDKITDNLNCSIVLNITHKISFSITHSPEVTKYWYPWILIACAVLMVAVMVGVIIQYRRRMKLLNPSKNQNGSVETSISFSNVMNKELTSTDTRVVNNYESANFFSKHQDSTVITRTEVDNDNLYEDISQLTVTTDSVDITA